MILVTGANGVVGVPLCKKLLDSGQMFRSVSRRPGATQTIVWDLQQLADRSVIDELKGLDTVFHCAPIWLLPEHLGEFAAVGMKRLIAFSSTSVLSKSKSTNPAEQKLVAQLDVAEHSLEQFCTKHGVALTIFRPSMVYGRALDHNVMQIGGFIRRFRIAIVAGQGNGERQPVHCDDLVAAVLFAQHNPRTFGKIYELAGAEVLSYRLMVSRIFEALDMRPRIVSLPLNLVRFGLRAVAMVSKFGYTPEMADRMNQDLVYDYSQATKDFGFMPREFSLDPQIDLGVRG